MVGKGGRPRVSSPCTDCSWPSVNSVKPERPPARPTVAGSQISTGAWWLQTHRQRVETGPISWAAQKNIVRQAAQKVASTGSSKLIVDSSKCRFLGVMACFCLAEEPLSLLITLSTKPRAQLSSTGLGSCRIRIADRYCLTELYFSVLPRNATYLHCVRGGWGKCTWTIYLFFPGRNIFYILAAVKKKFFFFIHTKDETIFLALIFANLQATPWALMITWVLQD